MSTIDKYPLQKRQVIKKILAGTIKWYFLLGIVLIIDRFTQMEFDIPRRYYISLFIAVPVLQALYHMMYHRRFFYDFGENFFTLREGIISRVERTIPYKRIHDIYVDQDILDRIFRLWDIHFSTLDRKITHHHIDGLGGKSAKIIREMILKKI